MKGVVPPDVRPARIGDHNSKDVAPITPPSYILTLNGTLKTQDEGTVRALDI